MPELRDVRDTRIAGESGSLIKLHLVKQTSLHSSCQSGGIYAVVNKERYLRELTETNLGHGRPYIIHSTPDPCTQLGFPDAVQTDAATGGIFGKSRMVTNSGMRRQGCLV